MSLKIPAGRSGKFCFEISSLRGIKIVNKTFHVNGAYEKPKKCSG